MIIIDSLSRQQPFMLEEAGVVLLLVKVRNRRAVFQFFVISRFAEFVN